MPIACNRFFSHKHTADASSLRNDAAMLLLLLLRSSQLCASSAMSYMRHRNYGMTFVYELMSESIKTHRLYTALYVAKINSDRPA